MSKQMIERIKDIIAISSGIIMLLGFVWFYAVDHTTIVNVSKLAEKHEIKIDEIAREQNRQDRQIAVIQGKLMKQQDFDSIP